MPTVRMVLEGPFRWVGGIGWPLLFCVATGCVGLGHPVVDNAVERGRAAEESVTGEVGWAGVEAVEGRLPELPPPCEPPPPTAPGGAATGTVVRDGVPSGP